MLPPILSIAIGMVALAFGGYEIYYGHLAHRYNRYAFYVIAGYLLGLPFLAVGFLLLFLPGRQLGGWEFLILVVWLFGQVWKRYKIRQARRADPARWSRWAKLLEGGKSLEWTKKP